MQILIKSLECYAVVRNFPRDVIYLYREENYKINKYLINTECSKLDVTAIILENIKNKYILNDSIVFYFTSSTYIVISNQIFFSYIISDQVFRILVLKFEYYSILVIYVYALNFGDQKIIFQRKL